MIPRTKDILPRSLPIAVLCLGLVVCAFSPHLWVIANRAPDSYEWARATTYLRQCAHPFDHAVEPAMRWRLLPALIAHGLGLTGNAPLVIPWLGVLALVSWVATRLLGTLGDWRYAAGGTLVFACTSACLVPIGWLGMNDAWIWLGLLVVAFSESRAALVSACLLVPWVDERFLIGLPLAWAVRIVSGTERLPTARSLVWPVMLVLPYAAIRIGLGGAPWAEHVERSFLKDQIRTSLQSLPYAPLAWWMGLRIAWAAVVYGILALYRDDRWIVSAIAAATAGISLLLASDMSRSIAILCPLAMLGLVELARRRPAEAPRIAAWAGVIALLIPAAHVVYHTIAPIDNLVFELVRLHRFHP